MYKKVTDTAWWRSSKDPDNAIYDKVKLSSYYVEMRDNVNIAVDLYYPNELNPETMLPAILHQTRYFRRQKYKLLSKILGFNKKSKRNTIDRFVKNGYAYVNADVRGSGASFGVRKMEWSPDEIKDGAELINWITAQSWSNGKVAVIGMSYTATAAEMQLIDNHTAVKAAVIQYSLFDVYTDVLMPGGIKNESFLKKWSMLNKFRDMNILPDSISKFKKLFFKLLINGVAPVEDTKEGIEQLKVAEEEHTKNYDIYSNSCKIKFRDDIGSDGLSLDKFSPHMYQKEIENSYIPIYSWSGWYDGAYPRSAINRFNNIRTSGSRLILGPWDHSGNHTANPFVQVSDIKTNFDYVGEILRFLNLHLKNERNGIEMENPIHYYTIGENKWKSANEWPPEEFMYTKLYFSGDSSMSHEIKKTSGYSVYMGRQDVTSGKLSRWKSQINVEKKWITYNKLTSQSSKRLLYNSLPLLKDVELTGHPIITLQICSGFPDLQFFVYLEEVDSNGKINYVTEGIFRSIHRKVSDSAKLYKTPYPWHSFKEKDSLKLKQGKVTEIKFDLLPISYLFRAETSIRLSICTSDIDNFETFPEKNLEFKLQHNENFASFIELPMKGKVEFK